MAIAGAHCVVTGATGNIGRGAARAFLDAGAGLVAVLGRDSTRLMELVADYLEGDERLVTIEADLSNSAGAALAAKSLRKRFGRIDHLVASSGPWWQVGDLSEVDPAVWSEAISANVTAHFHIWKYFSELMARGGSYVIVNGAAADGLPESGLTGICAHGLRGLSEVVRSEGIDRDIRTYELLISCRIADGPPSPGIPSDVFGTVFPAIASERHNAIPGCVIDIQGEADVERISGIKSPVLSGLYEGE